VNVWHVQYFIDGQLARGVVKCDGDEYRVEEILRNEHSGDLVQIDMMEKVEEEYEGVLLIRYMIKTA
jgi:hypothetical protein